MKKIIVVDLFAGTFSATKSIFAVQIKEKIVDVLAIFSLEYSADLCLKFLESDFYKKNLRKNKDIFFKLYHANILNKKATTKMIQHITMFLESLSKEEVYGILIFAGPPCTNYSSFHLLNNERIDGEKFEQKQKISDSLVLETLYIYEEIQKLAQKFLPKKIEVDLIIENPWSSKKINIPYKDDPFKLKGMEYSFELALRNRPFFQKFFVENGVFLYTSKHFWCYYDFENFSKKPTSIFSTLENIKSNECTHKKHKHSIQYFKNAEIRGRWPDNFAKYCIECFIEK